MIAMIDKLPDGPPREPLTERYYYDASGNMTYKAWAYAANDPATSAAVWSILRCTYNGSNQLTARQWADGNSAFDNILDNYAALTYK
jgi:YD repeat-containing protein